MEARLLHPIRGCGGGQPRPERVALPGDRDRERLLLGFDAFGERAGGSGERGHGLGERGLGGRVARLDRRALGDVAQAEEQAEELVGRLAQHDQPLAPPRLAGPAAPDRGESSPGRLERHSHVRRTGDTLAAPGRLRHPVRVVGQRAVRRGNRQAHRPVRTERPEDQGHEHRPGPADEDESGPCQRLGADGRPRRGRIAEGDDVDAERGEADTRARVAVRAPQAARDGDREAENDGQDGMDARRRCRA